MLIEHFDVVARVFLRGKRVELAPDRIDGLSDFFGGSGRGPLEQHVLHEVRDAALFVCLVARAAREPHAEAHRTHVAHRFSDETNPVIECVANDHAVDDNRCAKPLEKKGLRENSKRS